MQLCRRPSSTRADLARVLMGWLVVVLFVQSMAAAAAFVVGPLHHHRSPTSAVQDAHVHDENARHHHATTDLTVVQVTAEPTTDPAAQFVLALVFGALALAAAWRLRAQPGHVLQPALLWAANSQHPVPARRPPRF